MANAINLIDGLDGLAAGIVAIAATSFFLYANRLNDLGLLSNGNLGPLIAIITAGVCVGFLPYNFNPARIFMGDGGSQFLGFVLAIISIRGSSKSATAVALALPILVLGVPLLDLSTTVARRAFGVDREKSDSLQALLNRISKADSEHLHHNLLKRGWTARRAVLSLYLIASVFALAGYFSLAKNSLPLAALLLLVCLGSILLIKIVPFGSRADSSEDAPKGSLGA
jgi:UDP-GlcNAc:undecaprenyl-phosphate GlcNAc-1-phosphate transferase